MPDRSRSSSGPLGPKPSEEPLHDFLDRVDQRIGGDQPCPMCEGTEWASVTDRPTAFNLTDMHPDGREVPGSIRVALLYCVNCRFIRTHLLAP